MTRPASATESRRVAEGASPADTRPDLSEPPGPAPQRPDGSFALVLLTFVAAVGWLVVRVFAGLDFTDEMQYYAEIAALTRTGRLFEVDLFIQQLGYVLLLPLFKLHAALYPDQSYLVLFGRLVLFAGYLGVGLLFWRAARREGTPAPGVPLAAVALLLAWIPFQLFSPSYNTLAYLLIIAVLALWGPGGSAVPTARAAGAGILLAALSCAYPPAGVILVLVLGLDAARQGLRLAGRFAGFILGSSILLGAGMVALHGSDLPDALRTALRFSNSFALHVILEREQFASLLLLLVASGWFVWHAQRRVPPTAPVLAESTARAAASAATLLAAVGILLWLANQWLPGLRYIPAAITIVILMWYAVSLRPHVGRVQGTAAHRFHPWVLGAGCAALLVSAMQWSTGYFATAVWFTLLLLLAPALKHHPDRTIARTALVGTLLGATFAVTSGNGLHNFGVGAMAVMPFLALRAGLETGAAGAAVTRGWLPLAASALALLQITTGALHPYREDRDWWRFRQPVSVPAFKGLWISATKVEAVETLQRLLPPGALAGERLLVAGPQPWFYFATQAQPSTPMAYMHFSGGPAVDQLLAAQLFRGGEPDAILVPNRVPLPLHRPIEQWLSKGASVRKVTLPPALRAHLQRMTRYEIAEEVMLLRRRPAP